MIVIVRPVLVMAIMIAMATTMFHKQKQMAHTLTGHAEAETEAPPLSPTKRRSNRVAAEQVFIP